MNTPQRLSRYSHFIAKIFERFLAQDTILNGTCWITRSIDILFFSFFFFWIRLLSQASHVIASVIEKNIYININV